MGLFCRGDMGCSLCDLRASQGLGQLSAGMSI